MIIVNLKTYEEGCAEGAVRIARACQRVAARHKLRIVLCPQALDIRLVRANTKAEIFAQHIDDVGLGKFTGWISAEAAKAAGISGTLINHSEHRLNFGEISARVEACRRLGLTSVVCAATVEEAEQYKPLKPDFIAIEPPELIAGTISVSKARPELIGEAVRRLSSSETAVLAGAGIRTAEDVRVALSLGAVGVLSASEIAKSTNPEDSLDKFASAFPKKVK